MKRLNKADKEKQFLAKLKADMNNALPPTDGKWISGALVPEGAKPGEYAPFMSQGEAKALCRRYGFPDPVKLFCFWKTAAFITPDVARQILEDNPTNNRDVIRRNIVRMKMDLGHQKFAYTHHGIAWGIDGQLLDGRNRLYACATSGIGFWTEITL
ncbi:MAG: hypothetical protein KDD62_14820, partial [Bdellovibrionales bacterium]|nr:hypothetical protein [Bdellovibrionales bacterium]